MTPGALTDERDVREAYAAHAAELYGFAVRSLDDSGLAEEAVQETFLRAWRAGERFDPQIGSLRTWLFAILRHAVTAPPLPSRPPPTVRHPPRPGARAPSEAGRGRGRALGRATRRGAARLAGRGGDGPDRWAASSGRGRGLRPGPALRR